MQRAGEVEYLSGGAGEEERAAMTAQQAAFPLRIVFSEPGGGYAVADRVELSRGGAKVATIDNAGPWLMLKVAPGRLCGGRDLRRPHRAAPGAGRGRRNAARLAAAAGAEVAARAGEILRFARHDLRARRAPQRHFEVGIVNSAPLGVEAGQRCITLFCRV